MKVCAYCRVSTDKCDQQNSLDAQVRYFSEYIKNHDGWINAGIFYDEGISGTRADKRPAFNRMIEACRRSEVDLVITKEVSRFARNTVDALYYTRLLGELGVGVVFISDCIDTREGDGEFRLAIMASVAQEESRKTSQRVMWGQRRAMERGVVFGNGNIYGYDLKDGVLVKNSESEVVALIFRLCCEGLSLRKISRYLNDSGIPSKTGRMWSTGAVHRILSNEKYCGDLLQCKQKTVSYLTHKRKTNHEDLIFIENHHEPIVSREVFNKAKEELKSRRKGNLC